MKCVNSWCKEDGSCRGCRTEKNVTTRQEAQMNSNDWNIIIEALEFMRGLSRWFPEELREQLASTLRKAKAFQRYLGLQGEGHVE